MEAVTPPAEITREEYYGPVEETKDEVGTDQQEAPFLWTTPDLPDPEDAVQATKELESGNIPDHTPAVTLHKDGLPETMALQLPMSITIHPNQILSTLG